jgi:hypothetical protein
MVNLFILILLWNRAKCTKNLKRQCASYTTDVLTSRSCLLCPLYQNYHSPKFYLFVFVSLNRKGRRQGGTVITAPKSWKMTSSS